MKKALHSALLCAAIIALTFLFSTVSLAKAEPTITPKTSNVSKGIKLEWSSVKNATSYKIYRSQAKEKKDVLVAKTSSLSALDEKAEAGTRYGYRVVPVMKGSSAAPQSNEAFIRRLTSPKLEDAVSTTEGIKLSWTASKGATSYRIYRRTEKEKDWTLIEKTNSSTLTFTDKNVNDKDTYIYHVRARCSKDKSVKSNYLKTDFFQTPKITKISSNKTCISFKWTKSPKAVSYRIYRIASDGKGFERYKNLKASTLSFKDTNVKRGVKYGYVIRAIDKNGRLSTNTETTYAIFMKAPKMTGAENTSSGVKLTWSQVPSAHAYALYRRSPGSNTWKKLLTTKKLYATDKTAKNGKTYVYSVRPIWNEVVGTYDSKGATICFLSNPTGVKAEYTVGKGNRISWKDNTAATKFNVYKKAPSASEWTRIARTSKTYFIDKSAKQGTSYLYYVRAYIDTKYKSCKSSTVRSDGIDSKGKLVALTYDDGPSNSITPRILDTLEKYGAKATFFVVGSRIDGNSKPMQRAVNLGCEIGNHTYNHINLPSYEKAKIQNEIKTTNSLVKKYTGVTPVLARAPGGSTDSFSRKAVGMPFIYWSIDTRDWETLHAPSIISHVKKEVTDGSIVLMHDLYESTATATETIVPWLIKNGYQLVTVSQLMKYRGIELDKGVTYYNGYG